MEIEIKNFEEFEFYIGYPLRVETKKSFYSTTVGTYNNILSVDKEKEQLKVVVFNYEEDSFTVGDEYKVLIVDFYGGKYINNSNSRYFITTQDVKKNENRYFRFNEFLGKLFFSTVLSESLSLNESEEKKLEYLENKLIKEINTKIGAFKSGVFKAYSEKDQEAFFKFSLKIAYFDLHNEPFKLGKWYKYQEYYYYTNEFKENNISCFVVNNNGFNEEYISKDSFNNFSLITDKYTLQGIEDILDNLAVKISNLKNYSF